MKLCTTISSERGKDLTKTANDFITVTVTGEARENIAQLHVYYNRETHQTHITLQPLACQKYAKKTVDGKAIALPTKTERWLYGQPFGKIQAKHNRHMQDQATREAEDNQLGQECAICDTPLVNKRCPLGC